MPSSPPTNTGVTGYPHRAVAQHRRCARRIARSCWHTARSACRPASRDRGTLRDRLIPAVRHSAAAGNRSAAASCTRNPKRPARVARRWEAACLLTRQLRESGDVLVGLQARALLPGLARINRFGELRVSRRQSSSQRTVERHPGQRASNQRRLQQASPRPIAQKPRRREQRKTAPTPSASVIGIDVLAVGRSCRAR